MKKCNICKIKLNEYNFLENVNTCIVCKEEKKKYNKIYYMNNKNKIIENNKKWIKNNENKIKQDAIEFRKNNKELIKQKRAKHYKNNKEKINKNMLVYNTKRRKNDFAFKLRHVVSNNVIKSLKNHDSSKKGDSILKYLPYTFDQLKQHLESLFESWMSWENYGKYSLSTWNDNDSSTWKWNIDHIIPQSKLPYKNMEEENFKRCWALENLRPLSAKLNLIKYNKVIG